MTMSSGDDDVSIEVFIEEIEGEILLDGCGASQDELERARKTVALLRGVLPRLSDNADAARACFEMGTLLGWPLRDADAALESMRDAYQRSPSSLCFARGYRKAAMHAKQPKQLAAALENEARLSESKENAAQLNTVRACLLETELGNTEAARFCYVQAVEASPRAEALEALERLTLAADEPGNAATHAQKLASLVTDVAVRAEHLARAARHLDRSGDAHAALALAVQAQVDAPGSPAISFTLERLLTADGSLVELANLRERQISEGIIDATNGWFDAGVMARCRLEDPERAVVAFRAAADAAGSDAHKARAPLEQLSQVLEELERWSEMVTVEKRLLALCEGKQKAKPWNRIAWIYEACLDDEVLATQAYDHALAADPLSSSALEGAGRLIYRSGDNDERRVRLLEMHRLEAAAATSTAARGNALRRVGELLIEDDSTLDEGIESLRQALTLLRGNLTVQAALERALHRKRDWKMLVDLYEHQLEQEEEPSRQAWLLAQMGLIAADRLDDRPRAISALKRHMEMGQEHPSVSLIRLAELLEDGEDDDTHIAVLARIAGQTTGNVQRATILQRIAAVNERRGKFDEAIAAYDEAIRLAPATHPVHADAGRAFLRAGQYEELLALLLAGSRDGDDDTRADWLVRAAEVMDRHLDRTEDAIDALHSAIALDSESNARPALRAMLTRHARWEDLAAEFDAEDDSECEASELLRRAIIAEAVDDDTALALYARALDGGEGLAWLPYARLAALRGRWEDLEKRYASLEGSEAVRHHARYRAGEIAAERLAAPDRAVEHWLVSHAMAKHALAPVVALAPMSKESDAHLELLASLQAATRDKVTRLSCLRRRIDALDALGRDDEALQARLDVLALNPSNTWVLTEVELELEGRGDRVALADVLRKAAADPQLEPGLMTTVQAALGSVLEQLGLLRDAVVAYESAQDEPGSDGRGLKSRATLLGLRRCYDAIEDDRVGQVLAALAACPPAGPEQALCGRALAWWWVERGDNSAAIDALETALKAHPCDYDALNDLIEIAGDKVPARVTDAMLQAFEREEDPSRSRRLGLALATRLLRSGRLEPARETVDRLRDDNPDDLRVLMLHADVQEQRASWQRAAATLDRVATHVDAPPPVRVEALLRIVALQTNHLDDPAAAKAATRRILTLDAEEGDLSTGARLDIEETLGEYRAAATSLEELTRDSDLSDSERTPLLMRLATLHECHLDDPAAALATMRRITDAAGRDQVSRRLAALGEQTGRWDLTCQALEAALDDGTPVDPTWEAAVRRRLGDLLHQRLERSDSAFQQYERVLELEPTDTATLQALADIAAAQSADHAILFHRQLLAVDPDRASSYRALRQLFLQVDDTDGAFCAEAVLVGLNAANDEERYFYRQRRMSGTQKIVAKLNAPELELLFPERAEPALQLFAALEPALSSLFGVDRTSYGLDEDPQSSQLLTPIVDAVARLLGVTDFELRAISPRLRATSELGDPAMVLLPRTLEDALRREQQFVCGAVLGRIAFCGVAADPGRTAAVTQAQLRHAMFAACELAGAELPNPVARGAIYADIKARLDEALTGEVRTHVVDAAKRYAASEPVDESFITNALRGACLRTAILCAQDPSVAVRCLHTHGALFDGDAVEGQMPDVARAALPFMISAAHLRLRARLSGDVKGGLE